MNIIINQIRTFNRRRLTRRHLKRTSVNTPFGFKFFGPSAMQNGSFEITETNILIKLSSHADLFINVGANYGFYCCLALSKGIKTSAFEPVYTNLRILYKNIYRESLRLIWITRG